MLFRSPLPRPPLPPPDLTSHLLKDLATTLSLTLVYLFSLSLPPSPPHLTLICSTSTHSVDLSFDYALLLKALRTSEAGLPYRSRGEEAEFGTGVLVRVGEGRRGWVERGREVREVREGELRAFLRTAERLEQYLEV